MNYASRAYLSVVRWPDGMMHRARVDALVEACGMDPFHADAAVARGTPGVVATVDGRLAEEVVAPLRRLGAVAFAPSQEEINAVADRVAAKRLERAGEDAFFVEAWRDQGCLFRSSDAALMVRGRVTKSEARADVDYTPVIAAHAAGGPLIGALAQPDRTVTRTSESHEVLDIYCVEGPAIRVDGRKFNFDVLGKKGFSDRENLDALCALILASRPAAAGLCDVDRGFGQWRGPSHLVAARFAPPATEGRTSTRNQAHSFDFYSAWRWLVLRAEAQAS